MSNKALRMLCNSKKGSETKGGRVWLITDDAYIVGNLVSLKLFKKEVAEIAKELAELFANPSLDEADNIYLTSATLLAHGREITNVKTIHIPLDQIKLWGIGTQGSPLITSVPISQSEH